MNKQTYLENEIIKLVKPQKYYAYLYKYNLTKIKTFALHTVIIFAIQYPTIIHLPFNSPTLSLYPPIGISFVMFYLFGNNALFGLLVSSLLGYAVKGLTLQSIILYLVSDLGCGYLGAFLTQNIFSTDIRILLNWKEVMKFIKINTFLTCAISGFIKTSIVVLEHKIKLGLYNLFFAYINLWLSDLNGILVLSMTLLSWVYVPFSRDKITRVKINKLYILAIIVYVILCLILIKSNICIYLVASGMIISTYLCLKYGHLIGVTLSFILSTLYLTVFINYDHHSHLFSIPILHVVAPILLFNYILLMFYLSNRTLHQNTTTTITNKL